MARRSSITNKLLYCNLLNCKKLKDVPHMYWDGAGGAKGGGNVFVIKSEKIGRSGAHDVLVEHCCEKSTGSLLNRTNI